MPSGLPAEVRVTREFLDGGEAPRTCVEEVAPPLPREEVGGAGVISAGEDCARSDDPEFHLHKDPQRLIR